MPLFFFIGKGITVQCRTYSKFAQCNYFQMLTCVMPQGKNWLLVGRKQNVKVFSVRRWPQWVVQINTQYGLIGLPYHFTNGRLLMPAYRLDILKR
jgi:hypothetical protein